jgi:kumamolisin
MAKKLFPNSFVPMVATPGLAANGMIVNTVDPSHRSEIMPLHFSLALPKALSEDLEERVAKGEVISLGELNGKYIAENRCRRAPHSSCRASRCRI